MIKDNEKQPAIESKEVDVDVKVESSAASYARVLRVRTGVKAGADRCS